MSLSRVVPRAFAILALTTIAYLAIVVSLPLRRVAGVWQLRIRNAAFRFWSRGFARIIGMKIEVEGAPPEDAFLLVSNHVSYMDIILLATQMNVTFVAKADLNAWPLLGRAFTAADTIFIDRGRRRDVVRVMERIGRELDRGLAVVIFPEGTSSRGREILRFKPSLLEFASRRDHPVHYAALGYSTPEGHPPAQTAVCWWGNATFLPHLRKLLRLPYFRARLVFGPKPVHDHDRKILAEKLHAAIAACFTPSA